MRKKKEKKSDVSGSFGRWLILCNMKLWVFASTYLLCVRSQCGWEWLYLFKLQHTD